MFSALFQSTIISQRVERAFITSFFMRNIFQGFLVFVVAVGAPLIRVLVLLEAKGAGVVK